MSEIKKGIKIQRFYTEKGKSPFDYFEYEIRTSLIKGADGVIVFKQDDVEVPKDWSQVSTDILASKYFKRAGVPKVGRENSAKQVAHRLALTWTNWGEKMGYLTTDEDKQAFYDEIVYMILAQIFAPNSPQFFNTGLYDAYGIKGEKRGMWRVDPKTSEAYGTENEYVNPTPQACFILKEKDDLLSMMDGLKTETILFRAGSGVGSNFSTWRATNEKIKGGGKSSGVRSFLRTRDANAGSIKSGGISRRAAKMVSLDDDHPDIEEFVDWKAEEEKKAVALGKMGYDTDFNGVAYDTVSGQNSNNSVRLSNNFLNAVVNDGEWELKGRVDSSVNKKIKAKDLWNKINHASWFCADPGIQYDTTINEWNTCANDGKINASNPCFTGDMKILTTEGYKTFAELEGKSFYIIDSEGNSRQSKVWSNGIKNVIKLTLSDEIIIKCTLDHIFILENGKQIQAKDSLNQFLKSHQGESLQVIKVEDIETPEEVFDFSEPHGYLGVVGGIVVHNCSEYHFLDDTACNLASLNLMKFLLIDTGEFDITAYLHAIRLMQIVLDISVTMAQLPSREIAIGTYNYRTTGGGFGNLGQLLMTLGLPYDSDEGRVIAATLTSILTGQAYSTSAELAGVFGGFPRFKQNESSLRRVLENHRVATYGNLAKEHKLEYKELSIIPQGINHSLLNNLKSKLGKWVSTISQTAINLWDYVVKQKLFNSAFVTCIAPTGTIGLLMDFGTTSIEPLYNLISYKKLAGGGALFLTNEGVGIALKNLNYQQNQIEEILEYIKINFNIEHAPYIKQEHLSIFDTANKNTGGERFIEPMGHVKMLAATSAFLSGSSSKTVNLPNNATVEDFEKVHLESWKLGVKCVALYRDGCKASQPLNAAGSEGAAEEKFEDLKYNDLVKIAYELSEKIKKPTRYSPPAIRSAKVHEAKIGDIDASVKVGFYDDGEIAEVYADTNDSQFVKGLLNTISILASHLIQRKVPLKDITKMLRKEKYEPSGMVFKHPNIKFVDSLGDLIARILEFETGDYTYIQVKPGEVSYTKEDISDAKNNGKRVFGQKCSSCGGSNLRQNGTCKVCLECGTTTGCS